MTVKELCDYFDELGYKRLFDEVDSLPTPMESWEYIKFYNGDSFRYDFEISDNVTYLVYKGPGFIDMYDLTHLALITNEYNELTLAFWIKTDSMNRCINNEMNPGDDPNVVLEYLYVGKD